MVTPAYCVLRVDRIAHWHIYLASTLLYIHVVLIYAVTRIGQGERGTWVVAWPLRIPCALVNSWMKTWWCYGGVYRHVKGLAATTARLSAIPSRLYLPYRVLS